MTITTPPDQRRPIPPFDDELSASLAGVNQQLPTSVTPDMIPVLRQRMARSAAANRRLRRGGKVEVTEHVASGPPGAPDVLLLVCRPTALGAPAPAIYHLHPGGMIFGDHRTGLSEMIDWALDLGLVVVSVDYRLAPDHPYPAPLEDSHAGLAWTAARAAELGIDPERIIVVGTSAGGGLAAALTLLNRDDEEDPPLAGQMLLGPMIDDRNDTPSSHQMAGLGVWDRTSNHTGWSALLGDDQGSPKIPPYAAPARATDLSDLPPAFIDVGSAETFRDETVAYANGIWQAGGRAELHVWPGGFHMFDTFVPQAQLSQEARAARIRWLRRLLKSQESGPIRPRPSVPAQR